MNRYYKDAETLIEDAADLQRRVLLKHTAAVLEEIHDQLKARDMEIDHLRRELDEYVSAAQRLAVEKADLRQALADLMPILRDWEPDHSTGEERQKWARAQELLDA